MKSRAGFLQTAVCITKEVGCFNQMKVDYQIYMFRYHEVASQWRQ